MTPDQIAQRLSDQLRRINYIRRDQEIINASTRLSNLFAQNQGGGYVRRPIQVRANRIDLELSQEAKRSFLRQSNALFQADDFLAARPWWSGNATQTSSFLKRQRTTVLSTDSAAMARRKRIAALEDQYGRTGAENIVAEEDAERVAEAQRKRREARAQGRFAYNYDMMNAYDRERFDLIQRYGGGDEGIAKADAMMEERRKARMRSAESRASIMNRRERLRYMKEYPNFFKNSKMTAKEVKNIAKMIKRWEKTPVFGQILKAAGKSPLGIEGTVGLAALTGLNWFAQNADRANKDVVQWKNMQNLSGKASDAFTAAAYYAGIDKPGEISKRFGIATLKYGDAEKFYRTMGANMANLPPIARMAIAKQLGWDETDVAIADIFSGRIGFDETRDMNATRNMVSVGTALGFATGSGFWNTLNAILSTPFQSVGARTINSMDQFRFLQERSKEMIDSERGANNAAESADKFKSNGYNLDDKQSSAREVNITINTGDLSLPNVQNANDFALALANEGIRRSQRAEILTTFDTMAV